MAPKSRTGGAAPKTLDIRLAQAGHDARIAEALKVFLDRPSAPKLVGIMGGHGLPRSTTGAYAAVARLAKHLTREGYLIVTGGGPGAMEAGHLGATFGGATDNALEHALAALATIPRLPDKMDTIVAPDGTPATGSKRVFDDARL
jgi:predicted Rossmann-fold nucleotide-binding protein